MQMQDKTSRSQKMEDQCRQIALAGQATEIDSYQCESPIELTLEENEEDNEEEEIVLQAIERARSKLRDFELQFNGEHTSNSPASPAIIPGEYDNRNNHDNNSISDPLSRWYSESTADGFFHTIAEVRRPPSVPVGLHFDYDYSYQYGYELNYIQEDINNNTKEELEEEDTVSDACATCAFSSEFSRGFSRL